MYSKEYVMYVKKKFLNIFVWIHFFFIVVKDLVYHAGFLCQ